MLRIRLKHMLLAMAFIAVFLAGRKSQKDFPVWFKPRTTPVYVVRRNISAGETIQQGDCVLEEWPTDQIPPRAVRDMGEVIGAKPSVVLFAGEPVLSTKLQPIPGAELNVVGP